MLELKVYKGQEEVELRFEHSLLSLSKWESKYRIAFLTDRQKTPGELIDYFQFMLVDPDVDEDLVYLLTPEQQDEIVEYMNTPQTASHVPEDPKASKYNPEITTSELIYYWMVALKINWEAQAWHLSRLMMLVQITGYKNQPEKKRKPKEVYQDWIKENDRRRKMLGTNG